MCVHTYEISDLYFFAHLVKDVSPSVQSSGGALTSTLTPLGRKVSGKCLVVHYGIEPFMNQ